MLTHLFRFSNICGNNQYPIFLWEREFFLGIFGTVLSDLWELMKALDCTEKESF